MRLDEICLDKNGNYMTENSIAFKHAGENGIIPREMRELIDKHFPMGNALTHGWHQYNRAGWAQANYGRIVLRFIQPVSGPLVAYVEVYSKPAKYSGEIRKLKDVKYTIQGESDLEKIKKDYPKQ